MIDPQWIDPQAVRLMHERQLAEHGGASGVRDAGLLDSALMRAQQKFHYGETSLLMLAAAYGYGIARNHPFIDGNKRTAYVAMRTFLILNGWDIAASQEEKYTTMMALADGSLSEEALVRWLESVVIEWVRK